MLKEIVEQAHNWGNEFMFAKDKLEEYQSILLAPEIDDIEDDDLKYNIIHSIIENIVSDMFIDFDDNEVSELQNNIEKWFENDNVKKKLTKYQTKNIQHILDELDYLINNYDYGMIEHTQKIIKKFVRLSDTHPPKSPRSIFI